MADITRRIEELSDGDGGFRKLSTRQILRMAKKAGANNFHAEWASSVFDALLGPFLTVEKRQRLEASLSAASVSGSLGMTDEVGDLLFVAVNLARKAGVDPETALIGCNKKFEISIRNNLICDVSTVQT